MKASSQRRQLCNSQMNRDRAGHAPPTRSCYRVIGHRPSCAKKTWHRVKFPLGRHRLSISCPLASNLLPCTKQHLYHAEQHVPQHNHEEFFLRSSRVSSKCGPKIYSHWHFALTSDTKLGRSFNCRRLLCCPKRLLINHAYISGGDRNNSHRCGRHGIGTVRYN